VSAYSKSVQQKPRVPVIMTHRVHRALYLENLQIGTENKTFASIWIEI